MRESSCTKCGLCIDSIEIFSDFSESEQLKIMSSATHSHHKRDEVVISPDDSSNKIIIVRSGKLKISSFDEDGKEYIHNIYTEDEIIGEEYFFSDSKMNQYGIALTDLHICMITRDILENFMRDNVEFAIKMIDHLGYKLAESRKMLEILQISDVKKRILAFLMYRAEKIDSDEIELTRDTIASSINLTRETVSRKLQELSNEEFIQLIGYKKIKIVNLNKLKSIL